MGCCFSDYADACDERMYGYQPAPAGLMGPTMTTARPNWQGGMTTTTRDMYGDRVQVRSDAFGDRTTVVTDAYGDREVIRQTPFGYSPSRPRAKAEPGIRAEMEPPLATCKHMTNTATRARARTHDVPTVHPPRAPAHPWHVTSGTTPSSAPALRPTRRPPTAHGSTSAGPWLGRA